MKYRVSGRVRVPAGHWRHCIDDFNGPYYGLGWVHFGKILILMQLKKVIIFCKKKLALFSLKVGPTRDNCDFCCFTWGPDEPFSSEQL